MKREWVGLSKANHMSKQENVWMMDHKMIKDDPGWPQEHLRMTSGWPDYFLIVPVSLVDMNYTGLYNARTRTITREQTLRTDFS